MCMLLLFYNYLYCRVCINLIKESIYVTSISDTCFPVIRFTSMLQLLALYVTFHVSVTFVVSMKCESLVRYTTKSSMMCNNYITSLQFVF